MKLEVGMKVAVSCKELYEKCNNSHSIEIEVQQDENGNDAYWDLYNADKELACMDGETCEVISIDQDGFVTLKNNDGESGKLFTLSPDEANVGLFVNP